MSEQIETSLQTGNNYFSKSVRSLLSGYAKKVTLNKVLVMTPLTIGMDGLSIKFIVCGMGNRENYFTK